LRDPNNNESSKKQQVDNDAELDDPDQEVEGRTTLIEYQKDRVHHQRLSTTGNQASRAHKPTVPRQGPSVTEDKCRPIGIYSHAPSQEQAQQATGSTFNPSLGVSIATMAKDNTNGVSNIAKDVGKEALEQNRRSADHYSADLRLFLTPSVRTSFEVFTTIRVHKRGQLDQSHQKLSHRKRPFSYPCSTPDPQFTVSASFDDSKFSRQSTSGLSS